MISMLRILLNYYKAAKMYIADCSCYCITITITYIIPTHGPIECWWCQREHILLPKLSYRIDTCTIKCINMFQILIFITVDSVRRTLNTCTCDRVGIWAWSVMWSSWNGAEAMECVKNVTKKGGSKCVANDELHHCILIENH